MGHRARGDAVPVHHGWRWRVSCSAGLRALVAAGCLVTRMTLTAATSWASAQPQCGPAGPRRRHRFVAQGGDPGAGRPSVDQFSLRPGDTGRPLPGKPIQARRHALGVEQTAPAAGFRGGGAIASASDRARRNRQRDVVVDVASDEGSGRPTHDREAFADAARECFAGHRDHRGGRPTARRCRWCARCCAATYRGTRRHARTAPGARRWAARIPVVRDRRRAARFRRRFATAGSCRDARGATNCLRALQDQPGPGIERFRTQFPGCVEVAQHDAVGGQAEPRAMAPRRSAVGGR